MDILSDTLRVVRLTGALFFNADLDAPWAFRSPPVDELRTSLQSSSECLTLFHIVSRGECWITLDEKVSFLMREGDAVVLPRGNSHIMSSRQSPPPSSIASLPVESLMKSSKGGVASVAIRGSGDHSRIVCGYLHCDQKFNPMVSSLPHVIWVRLARSSPSVRREDHGQIPSWCILPLEEGQWLDLTLRHTVQEVTKGTPGNAAMLSRLSEIMFVEVLRRTVQQIPPEYTGWLAAVGDRSVGMALQLMHAHPEKAWTVDELASESALSRSTFAQRFTSLVGETPMQYLTGWRIQLAKHLLRHTNLTVGDIAARTGYNSEAAFNHAFKRYVGYPPVTWRREDEPALERSLS